MANRSPRFRPASERASPVLVSPRVPSRRADAITGGHASPTTQAVPRGEVRAGPAWASVKHTADAQLRVFVDNLEATNARA